jgi:hypothetical protein
MTAFSGFCGGVDRVPHTVAEQCKPLLPEEWTMTTSSEEVTGTSDQEYNVIWFTETCLKNAQRLETYIKDAQQAGNDQLAEFFSKAQAESRKGAELGKDMLRTLLGADR